MALRARQQGGLINQTMGGVKKVETKLYQGPVLQRAALGEMSNRGTAQLGLKATKSLDALKQQPPAVHQGKDNKETSTFRRISGKENSQSKSDLKKPKVEKKVVKNEKDEENSVMEVEERAEVEELAVAFSTQRLNVADIDAEDSNNPQLVSEYVQDIYVYLRQLENQSLVRPKYLEGQTITHKMRAILIDWLVQVHHRFTLLQETLYLTVAIIDRYLQIERNVPRSKLQLVGVTAMFLASKYEEMYCPDLGDFTYITDKAYSKKEILNMEINILKKLDFNVSYPLPLHFLRRNSKAGSVDPKHHTMAKYLMELCLPEYYMCHYKPSLIAAAALCLTLKLLNGGDWDDTLTYHSTYTEAQLMPVMCKMAAIVIRSHHSKQQAVRQKYEGSKFLKISKVPQLRSELVVKLAEKGALT